MFAGFAKRKYLVRAAMAVSLVVTPFAFATYLNHGYWYLFDKEQRKIVAAISKYRNFRIERDRECFLAPDQSHHSFAAKCREFGKGERPVLVWGDSHAGALSPGLRRNYSAFVQYTASSCPPISGQEVNFRKYCRPINDYVLEEISILQPAIVFMHANWLKLNAGILEHLGATIDQVKANSPGTRVFVVGGVPQWKPELPELLMPYFIKDSKIDLSQDLHISSPLYDDVMSRDSVVEEITRDHGATFVSLLKLFCREGKCKTMVKQDFSNELTTFDYGHLTPAASFWISGKIERFAETQKQVRF